MIRSSSRYLAALSLLVLSACAGSRQNYMSAYTDPDFSGRTYRRFVVAAELSDLVWRHRIETQLVEELNEHGIDAETGGRIFPPTREWTDELRRAALMRHGSDALLVIEEVDTWTREVQVPQTTTTDVKREKKEKSEDKGGGKKEEKETEHETITTTTNGGYTSRSDWKRYRVRLVDIATDRTAWLSEIWLEASTAGVNNLRRSVVEQLQSDQLAAD